MSIILVSDVFGITPALLAISNKLGVCSIVDPYKGQIMDFQNEAEAYSCFVKTVGLDSYLSSLSEVVALTKRQTTLIGFSVGAATIWRLSQSENNHFIKQAFCFYGSQIRNYTQIEPCFKINLIFPANEPHFYVVALQSSLSKKVNVETKKVEYLHGFMNYNSSNYNKVGYTDHLDFLCSIIT